MRTTGLLLVVVAAVGVPSLFAVASATDTSVAEGIESAVRVAFRQPADTPGPPEPARTDRLRPSRADRPPAPVSGQAPDQRETESEGGAARSTEQQLLERRASAGDQSLARRRAEQQPDSNASAGLEQPGLVEQRRARAQEQTLRRRRGEVLRPSGGGSPPTAPKTSDRLRGAKRG